MRSILKTSVIGGLLLAMFYHLSDRFYFPIFPIHIVLIPGGMMFAINGFLKPVANRAKYTYITGVCICFFYAILAFMIAYAAFNLIYLSDLSAWSFKSYFTTATYAIRQSLPLILLASFLTPLMYMGRSKTEIKSQTDILDEDL